MVATTFYYLPGGSDDELQHLEQPHSSNAAAAAEAADDSLADSQVMELMVMNSDCGTTNSTNHNGANCDRFDYTPTTGCYAGLDEELFYNAKYESINDEPPYNSMYYTATTMTRAAAHAGERSDATTRTNY